jgi:hypothetical protein
VRGNIDRVTPEGVVEGWCWNEDIPDDRVTAILAVDGVEVARVVANVYREDLKQAGIGDGHHAFRHVLPVSRLESHRTHLLTMMDVVTGVVISGPYEFRSPRMLAFDDRLHALEARAAFLEGRVDEIQGSGNSEPTATELFAIVGAFFERLSRDIAHGEAVKPERQLGDSIRSLTKTHPPITFPPKQNPSVSVVVEAAHPFGQIYACLAAIKRAMSRLDVRVTVLDTGAFEEVALLPSIVRGVRYIRTSNDLVSEWTEAERNENGPLLMFLSGQVVMDENFLDVMVEWFDSHPRTGAIGGCEVNSDGTLQHGGFCLFDERLEDCSVAGHSDNRVDMTISHPVHALSYQAAVIRRTAFEAAGGLDPVFGDDLGAAVIDLCFRLREAGWNVLCEPRAKVALPKRSAQGWTPSALSTPSLAGDMLFDRWFDVSTAQRSPLVAGVATIIAQAGEFPDELEAVRYLREAGYLVVYLGSDVAVNENDAERLKKAGAIVASNLRRIQDFAPALVFTSSECEVHEIILEKSKNARIVFGLLDLKRNVLSNLPLSKVHS